MITLATRFTKQMAKRANLPTCFFSGATKIVQFKIIDTQKNEWLVKAEVGQNLM